MQGNIDSLVDSLIETEMQTLNQRIGSNTVDLVSYQKHDGGSGTRITGKALLVNKIPNLSVIDVDINKSYDDDKKEMIRKNIIQSLSDDDVIVKTASGGLHIYCNTDLFFPTSNRMIKCYSCEDFDIDLMSCKDELRRSLVVMAGSKVRKNHKSPISTYSFIRGSYESKLKRTVNDVLNDLDIKLTIEQNEEVKQIIKENTDSEVSDELAQAIIEGFDNIEIHNDSGSMKIEKEVTLFTLFQGINSLPKAFIEQAYEIVYECCNLTDKAKTNFDNAKARFAHLSTSPFVLVKILKLYNKPYFDDVIKPLLKKQDQVIHKIDLNDNFTLTSMNEKAEKHRYSNKYQVIEDLSKVIRRIDAETVMYIKKIYNVHDDKYILTYVTQTNMKEMLKSIKLWKIENKTLTAWDVLNENSSKLMIKGVKFNSNDPDIFSTFQGYKYKILDTVNESLIVEFLKLIHDVICEGNDELYKYVIGWIASLIQKPGIKNETALILKGLQGIGKNTFTNVISELLSGYSCKNVTDISELTGNFNSIVEDKMLIVLNEVKNCGDDRLANFNALKSIITDSTIRINEKNQPRRTSENVANFIFVTNNSFPVKVEVGDRRYVVLQCNGLHKGDDEYFKQMYKSFNKEFYDNLLTYFIKYDINDFNPRRIPMTEAKQDLIDASKSPLDQWICDHYDELIKGIISSDALLSKPSEMKDRAFQLQLKDKCEHKKIQHDGVRKWYYILKDECKSLYKQTIYESDDEI